MKIHYATIYVVVPPTLAKIITAISIWVTGKERVKRIAKHKFFQ
jgi:hypothetical protein